MSLSSRSRMGVLVSPIAFVTIIGGLPEQVSTCTPDSDRNIVDPAVSAKHPGTAFMEMQFYPP